MRLTCRCGFPFPHLHRRERMAVPVRCACHRPAPKTPQAIRAALPGPTAGIRPVVLFALTLLAGAFAAHVPALLGGLR